MSTFDKYLAPITIDSSSQQFGYNDGAPQTVSLDKGTYDSILEVCDNLEDNLGPGFTVTVSSLGIVSISSATTFLADWANTDDALSTILGFTESETASNNTLTATNQHANGYYPGLVSYGRNTWDGAGVVTDTLWIPQWKIARAYSGTGEARIVGPSSALYRRKLSYSLISGDEVTSDYGAAPFFSTVIASQFRWYPDREKGTVASPGAKNSDYYLVTLVAYPRFKQSRSGSHYTFDVEMNREP